jgi:acid phosphatase
MTVRREVASSRRWLQEYLDAYVQQAQHHNSLLIVTREEEDGKEKNRIAMLLVGPMVRPGQYNEPTTPYNMLRRIEDMYGLSYAGTNADALPITEVWRVPSCP